MQFQHCSVAGRAYKEAEGKLEPHCPSRSPHQTRAAAAEAEPISDEMQVRHWSRALSPSAQSRGLEGAVGKYECHTGVLDCSK